MEGGTGGLAGELETVLLITDVPWLTTALPSWLGR
jgi:hypothetical protein